MRFTKPSALLSLAALALTLTACTDSTTTYRGGSRSELYPSIDALAGDSSAVVTGSVYDQTVQTDDQGSTVTVSTFVVSEPVPVEDVGDTLDAEPTTVDTDTEILLRQLGDPSMADLPAPILTPGQNYLLFITPSMLPGDEAAQFYITGGSAGYYESTTEPGTAQRGTPTFEKVGDEGDTLPETVTPSDLEYGKPGNVTTRLLPEHRQGHQRNHLKCRKRADDVMTNLYQC